MKKLLVTILTFILALSVLSACGTKKENAAEETTSVAETTATETTAAAAEAVIEETTEEETEAVTTEVTSIAEAEPDGLGDVLFDEKEAAYAEIIDLHKKAIAEGWDIGTYMDNDMSFLFAECKSEEQVGFCLMYMDNSKYPMLLMGTITGEDFTDMMILDGYYLFEEGTMNHVISSGDRYRYYWMPDEAGPQLIAFEGSSSAATSYNYYFVINNGELECVQGIIADFDVDPENPWYQTYTADYSIESGEKVSEEYAAEIVTAYEKQYKKVPYRPITDGYDFLAE